MALRDWMARYSPVRALACATVAGTLSTAALAWRGRAENRSTAAPLNAISHWIWGRPALHRDDATLDHTAIGTTIHFLSSLFWAVGYEALRAARRRPTAATTVADAAAVTAVAAVVDLKLVPDRLTPGFEERLSDPSLVLVYLSFGVGLALTGLALLDRR